MHVHQMFEQQEKNQNIQTLHMKMKKNFKNFAENMAFNMKSLQKMNPIKNTNLENLNYTDKLNAQ